MKDSGSKVQGLGLGVEEKAFGGFSCFSRARALEPGPSH